MKWFFRLIMGAVILALLAFGMLAKNQQQVSLEFLKWTSPEMDLYWYLLITLVLGIFIGWVLAGYSMFSLKLAERRERKQKLQAQTELDALKAAAVAPAE